MAASSATTAPASSLADLKSALKDTLEARGSLGQLKARIRAEIFAALDDESVPRPRLSNENLIINELIREYLVYNGYRHAHSVFLAESGQPTEPPFHRDFLAKELHVEDDSRFAHIPLLYGMVASRQQPHHDAGARTSPAYSASDEPLRPRASNPPSTTAVLDGCPDPSYPGDALEPTPLIYHKS